MILMIKHHLVLLLVSVVGYNSQPDSALLKDVYGAYPCLVIHIEEVHPVAYTGDIDAHEPKPFTCNYALLLSLGDVHHLLGISITAACRIIISQRRSGASAVLPAGRGKPHVFSCLLCSTRPASPCCQFLFFLILLFRDRMAFGIAPPHIYTYSHADEASVDIRNRYYHASGAGKGPSHTVILCVESGDSRKRIAEHVRNLLHDLLS